MTTSTSKSPKTNTVMPKKKGVVIHIDIIC